jgi:hypothetical protein
VRHPRGGKFSRLENLGDCELRAGCEVTGKVLCYVRSYLDVCNVHALAGNEFFFFGFGELYEGLRFQGGFRLRWEGGVVSHVRISFWGDFILSFSG